MDALKIPLAFLKSNRYVTREIRIPGNSRARKGRTNMRNNRQHDAEIRYWMGGRVYYIARDGMFLCGYYPTYAEALETLKKVNRRGIGRYFHLYGI